MTMVVTAEQWLVAEAVRAALTTRELQARRKLLRECVHHAALRRARW